MGTVALEGPHAPVRTCIVAGTPWCGSQRLGQLLTRTGAVGLPSAWFDPLRIPRLGRQMGLSPHEPDWLARYLSEVQQRAASAGTCSLVLTWTQQRWLMHVARSALGAGLATSSGDPAQPKRLDTEVLDAWFPNASYVRVRSRQIDTQALRWYFARHQEIPASADPGLDVGAVDLQEVRWLETVVRRHERGWTTFFAMHDIHPVTAYYEDLLLRPADSAQSVVSSLGLPAGHPDERPGEPLVEHAAEILADRWAGAYRRVRPRLRTTPGVRAANR